MEIILIKCNVAIANQLAGSIVKVKANAGYPIDEFWRRRLEEAKDDNCCQIYTRPRKDKKRNLSKNMEIKPDDDNIIS